LIDGSVLTLAEVDVWLGHLCDLISIFLCLTALGCTTTLRWIQQVPPGILADIVRLRANDVLQYLYAISQVPVFSLQNEVLSVFLILFGVKTLYVIPEQLVALMQFLDHLDGLDQLLGQGILIKAVESE